MPPSSRVSIILLSENRGSPIQFAKNKAFCFYGIKSDLGSKYGEDCIYLKMGWYFLKQWMLLGKS
jgi:hypothetical protein